MTKKRENQSGAREPIQPANPLGKYLFEIRTIKKLTLREVEEATDREVSNAYLSQLETGRIAKPSPNILHALALVYGVPYGSLMQKAGYVSPTRTDAAATIARHRHGRAATFANEDLTPDEEAKLLEYLAFLRSRRKHGDKA